MRNKENEAKEISINKLTDENIRYHRRIRHRNN